MKPTDSQKLLADYARTGSEVAFRDLVTRYVDLVYSTAVRLVDGDAHLAQDVAQTVFVDLARKACGLSTNVMLGGWLHRHTCFTAANALRGERRRRSRERQAVEMNVQNDHAEANLAQVRPILDEAINQLGTLDRTAILLRFFEQQDLRSVGEALGSNEEAARKRVTRALDKLHSLLKRRGVALSATALGGVLTAEAISAAPAGLALSLSGPALAGAVGGGGTALTLLKIIAMTKVKTGILSAIVVAGVATSLVIQHQAQAGLRDGDQAFRQQAEQLDRLQKDNERLTRMTTRIGNVATNDPARDLARLRAEAVALRTQTNDLTVLRQENRRRRTPPPDSPKTPLQAKEEAIVKMGYTKNWALALFLYADKNDGQLPESFGQAAAFLDAKTRDETHVTTDQFELVYQGSLKSIANPQEVVLIREKDATPPMVAGGNWIKAYGFADGHVELHSEADGNFEAWEKQHILNPGDGGDVKQ